MSVGGQVSNSIVIPVRERYGACVRNCLRSIQLQTLQPIETIIADYGSSEDSFRKLLETVKPFRCQVVRCKTENTWSLSIARNIGLRRAQGRYVTTLDVDCILEPKVMESTFKLNKRVGLVVSQLCYLPATLSLEDIELPKDYSRLRSLCKPLRVGFGAFMSASLAWWFHVHGFDERMKGWGAEDNDLWKRATLYGLKRTYLNKHGLDSAKVFHQFHKPQVRDQKQRRFNRDIWLHDKTVIRNNESWGLGDVSLRTV